MNELADLGFSKSQRRTPTLLVPIHSVDGRTPSYIHRPDHPRSDKKNKDIKYENPKGEALRVDCPPRCRENLKNPNIRLWITEGVKKADTLASRGECVIDLLGVHGYKHKNEFGAPIRSLDIKLLFVR